MRLLVCGTRHATQEHVAAIRRQMLRAPPGSVLIHGAARGVDLLAAGIAEGTPEIFAQAIPFPADWTTSGRRAGPLRNQQMIDEGRPDRVLAFHTSPDLGLGTRDMVRRALAARIPVEIHMLTDHPFVAASP